MESADKFKLMAMASKDAIEDFNDLAEDKATSWAFDEITRLTAAVESLTAEKEAAEREIKRLFELNELYAQQNTDNYNENIVYRNRNRAQFEEITSLQSSLAQAREEIALLRIQKGQLENREEAAEQREKGLVALVGKVSDIVGQPSTCDHCEEAWEAINEFNKAALAAASKEEADGI